jgi:hypothetical protein
VPLTLEGPTWTMRGISFQGAVAFRTVIDALGAGVTAWSCSCGAASVRDGGDRLRPVPGQPCAAARRAVGLPPEGCQRRKLPPSSGETPATFAAYHRSLAALLSPVACAQLALPVPAVGVARRRCALEAVKKLVTVFPGARGRR